MILDLGICGLIGLGVGWLIGYFCRKRPVVVVQEKPLVSTGYDLNDVLRLAATNHAAIISSLFSEYKVNKEMPEFYGKYTLHNKRARDKYYVLMLELLGRKSPQGENDVAECGGTLSAQDRLLLKMHHMGMSNKIIAQVLGVNMEALKKRKNRLKLKVSVSAPEEASLSLQPPAGE